MLKRHEPSSDINAPSPINLPTPLLAAIVGGVFVILSAISAILFFCSWRRKPKVKSRRSIFGTRAGLLQADADPEKQSTSFDVDGYARSKPPTIMRSASTLPVFEFSPPSPHWRPSPSYTSVERQRNRSSPRGGGATQPRPMHVQASLRTVSPRPRRPSSHRHQDSRAMSHTRLQAKQKAASLSSSSGRHLLNSVPRIEVHPAQECRSLKNSSPKESQTQSRFRSSELNRSDKAGGRPLSGLGITTIDFTARSVSSTQHAKPLSPSLKPTTTKSSASASRSNLSPPSGSSHSLSAPARRSTASSFEDVRLAYTLSASSIGSMSSNGSVHNKPEPLATCNKSPETGRGRQVLPSRDQKTTTSCNGRKGSTSLGSQRNARTGNKQSEFPSRDPLLKRKAGLIFSGVSGQRKQDNTIDITKHHDFGEIQGNNAKTLSKSSSSKRGNLSKRVGLDADAIDESTKSELYALRSLGSASFDSLIAYLKDTIEPDDELVTLRSQPRKAKRQEVSPALLTSEDTIRSDEGSFQKWIGNLTTSASLLQLTGIQLDNDKKGTTLRRTRSRSKSVGRAALKDSKHADDQTEEERSKAKDQSSNLSQRMSTMKTTHDQLRTKQLQGHINDAEELHEPKRAPTELYSSSSVLSPVRDRLVRPLSLTRTPLLGGSREDEEFISALPSFTIPSSATKLFSSFVSDESGFPGTKTANSQKSRQQDPGRESMTTSSIVHSALSPRGRSTALLEFLPQILPPSSPHRLSIDSTSSSDSSVGSLTQRHDWGRESLTPRFNLLRAVLEGHCDELPPLPIHEGRDDKGRVRKTRIVPSIPETPGARGEPGSTPLMLFGSCSAVKEAHERVAKGGAHA